MLSWATEGKYDKSIHWLVGIKCWKVLKMPEISLDLREIAQPDRQKGIFGLFDDLPVGGAFELVDNHNPRPLYHQFLALRQGAFFWTYLMEGPDLWRVRIVRMAPNAPSESICCGHCGG